LTKNLTQSPTRKSKKKSRRIFGNKQPNERDDTFTRIPFEVFIIKGEVKGIT